MTFLKELFRGIKWIAIILCIIILLVAGWVGFSWCMGYAVDHLFDLKSFGSIHYISFGSCVLVFTLLVQILTVIFTIWAILAWGKSRGVIKEK